MHQKIGKQSVLFFSLLMLVFALQVSTIMAVVSSLSTDGANEKLLVSKSIVVNESNTTVYTGTLTIGDILLTNNAFNYTFDGFVDDAVAIHVAEGRTLFIPLETTDWVTLPSNNDTFKLKIKKIDKLQGVIDIELSMKTN